MAVAISSCVIRLIQSAVADAEPHEACGLLFGTQDLIESANLTRNVAADSRRHFEIDPTALFAALRAERAGGPRIVGHWHSHPSGRCEPSTTDADLAMETGRLWLIATRSQIGLWRATPGGALHGRFEPLEFFIA